jgi:hypothetical protein
MDNCLSIDVNCLRIRVTFLMNMQLKKLKKFYIYQPCEMKLLESDFNRAIKQLEKEKQTNK